MRGELGLRCGSRGPDSIFSRHSDMPHILALGLSQQELMRLEWARTFSAEANVSLRALGRDPHGLDRRARSGGDGYFIDLEGRVTAGEIRARTPIEHVLDRDDLVETFNCVRPHLEEGNRCCAPPARPTIASSGCWTTAALPIRADNRYALATMTIDPSRTHTIVDEPPGGVAERTFLLLNGASQSLHTWDHVVPALLELGRVIRLDVPGVGESPAPEEPYSFEELAGAVLAVARPHIEGPLIVIGHAWGARAAQVLARDHGDEVTAVVIGSNGGRFPQTHSAEDVRALAQAGRAADDEAWAAAFERGYCAAGFRERDPERARWLFNLVRNTRSHRAIVAGAAERTPVASYWGRFDCPALLLYGAEDKIGTAENAEDLHAALPDSKLIYIEQAGHFVICEQPDRFASEVRAWVEERGL